MVEALAAGAGLLVRGFLFLLRVVVGGAGPLLVTYGTLLIYEPAAYIVAGLFVLWLLQQDRPDPKPNEGSE